jgi:hypothetical protein
MKGRQEERPHLYGYSYGIADHVNEDDEKLNNSTLEEEDQRSVLIIGGIKIFLPRSQVEASVQVSGATGEIQPVEIVIEEEMDQILKSVQVEEEEEHSEKLLKIFSQEVEQEITAELKPTVEEETYNMDFVDLCEELEALERRVIV